MPARKRSELSKTASFNLCSTIIQKNRAAKKKQLAKSTPACRRVH